MTGLCTRNFNELDREWHILRNTGLPFTGEDAKEVEIWAYIANIKKGDGSLLFPFLSEFAQNILTLPHSSANVERIFSEITLIKTNKRNCLGTETLKGLLFTKDHLKQISSEPSKEHLSYFNKNIHS